MTLWGPGYTYADRDGELYAREHTLKRWAKLSQSMGQTSFTDVGIIGYVSLFTR